MSKKLSKKQLKEAKGGNLGDARAEAHIVVPAIDAPIPPDPHVVIVVKGRAAKAKLTRKLTVK